MIRTKREFERFFREEILPSIRDQYEQDGRIDYPARREAWNNTTDAMAQDRAIPPHGREWVCPW